MKKWICICALLSLTILVIGAPMGVMAAKTPQGIIDSSAEAFRQMALESDAQTMGNLLKGAEGIAIFPSVIKAGFVFGGRYGEGLVLKKDKVNGGWFGPNFISIAGASWGLQAGVQSTALVLVIMNDKGMRGFNGDKVTLGADAGIAAGPVGRQSGASTDFKASIYSYSMSKGLFAGISLEGAVIEGLSSDNNTFWGSAITGDEILARKSGDQRVFALIEEINSVKSK